MEERDREQQGTCTKLNVGLGVLNEHTHHLVLRFEHVGFFLDGIHNALSKNSLNFPSVLGRKVL